MISGYFMCESQKAEIIKPLRLYLEVILFSLIRYGLGCATGHNTFSVFGLLHCLIPLNWYVTVYVALYLISPYLNKIIRGMPVVQFRTLLIVGLLVFSFWPSTLDAISTITGMDLNSLSPLGTQGSGNGYTIVNFVLMYFLGAYLKKSVGVRNTISIFISLTVYVLCIVFLMFYSRISFSGALAYCNPFVIVQAVALFKVFQTLRIKSRLINSIAGGSFGVYLLHSYFFQYIQIERFVTRSIFLIPLHVIVSSIMIYIICAVIYWIYSKTLSPILNMGLKKLSFIAYDVY